MKRLLLILTLLIPTIAMGEVVEVTCTTNGADEPRMFRFDFDKKTVSYVSPPDVERPEVPLEVFDDYLVWFEKLEWVPSGKPSIFVFMMERDTGKLHVAYIYNLGSVEAKAETADCTRRI